jgi:hypothetical protein
MSFITYVFRILNVHDDLLTTAWCVLINGAVFKLNYRVHLKRCRAPGGNIFSTFDLISEAALSQWKKKMRLGYKSSRHMTGVTK